MLQCGALFFSESVLQGAAVCQGVAVCSSVLHSTAVSCSVLNCFAVRCSVLQRFTVCCSVLQCSPKWQHLILYACINVCVAICLYCAARLRWHMLVLCACIVHRDPGVCYIYLYRIYTDLYMCIYVDYVYIYMYVCIKGHDCRVTARRHGPERVQEGHMSHMRHIRLLMRV